MNCELLADTPFPMTAIKKHFAKHKCDVGLGHWLSLNFFKAKNAVHKRSEAFDPFYDHKGHHHFSFDVHSEDDRERLLNYISLLIAGIAESGGIGGIAFLHVSCCYNVVADALALFQKASRRGFYKIDIQDRDGADPAILERIITSVIGDNQITRFSFYSKNLAFHESSLRVLFNNSVVECLHLSSRGTMTDETIRMIAKNIRNNPDLRLLRLEIKTVPATAHFDVLLADIIRASDGTNIRWMDITFDSAEWTAAEITRAIKKDNYTLEDLRLYPLPENVYHPVIRNDWSQQRKWCHEIDYFEALNKAGRGAMRGTTIPPDVFIQFLVLASTKEGNRDGRYLYPILRESVSGWIGYLSKQECLGAKQVHPNSNYTTDSSENDRVIRKCRARLEELCRWYGL